jgi:hypothetical protein
MLDVGVTGSHASRDDREDEGEMEGERIYALGFRRVKYCWYKKASVDTAFLETHNTWEPFSDTRTSGFEDSSAKVIEVQLEDDDEISWLAGAPDGLDLRVEEDGEEDCICLS